MTLAQGVPCATPENPDRLLTALDELTQMALRPVQAAAASLLLVLISCGGGSKSPQAPTPTPKPTPPPPWSLPGHVVATLSGAPVAHATVNAFIATAESGTDGSFTLNTTPAPAGSQAVTMSADGYRPRETVIKWPRTEDLVIDLMSTAKPFDETLYSQLAHGTLEYPGKDYGLFRWSSQGGSTSRRRMSSAGLSTARCRRH